MFSRSRTVVKEVVLSYGYRVIFIAFLDKCLFLLLPLVRSGQVPRSATGKPCKPVLPVHGSGCWRLNWLPH